MKKIFSLVVLIFSSYTLAEDCVDCTPPLKVATDLSAQVESLQKTAAVDCEAVLKSDVDQEYDENFSGGKKITAPVAGLTLSGTADEIKFLKLMLGEKPNSWSKANSCKTVLCALTKLYDSEETAKRTLNIAKRNNYIVSLSKDFTDEDKKSIGQLFSSEEIRIIDIAYKKLPTNFRKLKSLSKLKRMPNGYSKPGSPNTVAYARPGYSGYWEGEITFISKAFGKDKKESAMTAVHELAHHLDFSNSNKVTFGISESPEFLKLSGWKLNKKYEMQNGKKVLVEEWKRPETKGFVRDYAGTEPAEDFAEAVSYYMYEPEMFRELDPAKYDFIKKKVFNGQEFDKDIDLKVTKDQLLARCLADTKKISLYGLSFGKYDYFSTCLDGFIKEFSITDPVMCFSSTDMIEQTAHTKIQKELDAYNEAINACNTGLDKIQQNCHSENNFQKNCIAEKCNIPSALSEKVSFNQTYGLEKQALTALKKKAGKSDYLTTLLIAGFSEGKVVSKSYSLAHQKSFADNAVKGIMSLMEKENIKIDQSKSLESEIYYDLVISKDTAPMIESFEEHVAEVATKSKDKNLDLIKKWAASHSLPESANFEALAESLTKLGR